MLAIKVPCSSANLGSGFDVIGLALSIYLEVQVSRTPQGSPPGYLNCNLSYRGIGAENVPLAADQNLITQCALYVLRCHGLHDFPVPTEVHIINDIPLGRGLGSSGAAVVAGVMLGNAVGGFSLSKARMFDYCLMIERHPDNVAAALYGGFVGTFLRDLDPADVARKEIPLSEVLPAPAGGIDTGMNPPEPPRGIGHYIKFKWAPEVKIIAIVPDFEVKTADARGVLPTSYPRPDIIFNLQRIALLTTALGQSPPDPELIYEGMRDKVHQPFRAPLVPGLAQILTQISPETHPGLLGICLSGAGPTILALATKNYQDIAAAVIKILSDAAPRGAPVTCEWKQLHPAEGATISGLLDES